MAYVPLQDQEEDKKKVSESEATGKVLGSGSPATITGSEQSAPQSGGKPKQDQGTSSGAYTNLQSYITANEGNDAEMGQAVRGTVDQTAGETDQARQAWQQDVQTGVEQGTAQFDEGLFTDLKNDPTKVRKDELDTQLSAGYTGYNAANEGQGYVDVQKGHQKVGQAVTAATDEGVEGLQPVLQDVYGGDGKRYDRGEQLLDSFVTKAGEGGMAALKGIADDYAGYDQNLATAQDELNTKIADGKRISDEARAAAEREAQVAREQWEGVYGSAAEQAKTANTTANTEYDRLSKAATNKDYETLGAAIGVDPADLKWAKENGMDLTKLFSKTDGVAKAGDFMAENDQAGYSALMSLLGLGGQDLTAGGGVTGPQMKKDIGAGAGTLRELIERNQTQATQAATERQRAFDRMLGLDDRARSMPLQSGKQLLHVELANAGITDHAARAALVDGIMSGQVNWDDYVTQGTGYGLGDAFDAKERAQYNELAAMLGIDPLKDGFTSVAGEDKGYIVDAGAGGLGGVAEQLLAALNAPKPEPKAPSSKDKGYVGNFVGEGADIYQDLSKINPTNWRK